MGGWNDEKFHEDELVWHPVVNQLFWAIKLDDVLIDGVSTGYCTQEAANCTVAPDSGTSYLTFPEGHYSLLEDGGFTERASCTLENFISGKELTYVINGVNYVLPAHHWTSRTVDESNADGGSCAPVISQLDADQPGLDDMHIVGDLFMELWYTIHDHENDQVGFAPAIHDLDEILE